MRKSIKKYQAIRSALITRGMTLRKWALKNDYPVTTVYGAAKGERFGVAATEIRNKLHDFITQN